jgi:hypothetical protein
VGRRQLQALHCAAADWQWGMRDGTTALAWVSRHYAAACNAEALFHGEAKAAGSRVCRKHEECARPQARMGMRMCQHRVTTLSQLCTLLQRCQTGWIPPRLASGTCTCAAHSCWCGGGFSLNVT